MFHNYFSIKRWIQNGRSKTSYGIHWKILNTIEGIKLGQLILYILYSYWPLSFSNYSNCRFIHVSKIKGIFDNINYIGEQSQKSFKFFSFKYTLNIKMYSFQKVFRTLTPKHPMILSYSYILKCFMGFNADCWGITPNKGNVADNWVLENEKCTTLQY